MALCSLLLIISDLGASREAASLLPSLCESSVLVVKRREVAERRVQAPAFVPALDPGEDGGLQFAAGRPTAAAGELFVQYGEERLADGVVERAARGADRDRDAGGASGLAEDQRHVLGGSKGSLQRLEGEAG